MDNPKVSVLIPLYNRKHYIEQCIDSALNQAFQENYEIIVRDNCSTDGSFEFVAEKYAQQISEGKIRLYKNAENLGEWGNTNALINDAEGKYIAILHSDDMYLPHAIQHLYEVAEVVNADVVHESFCLNSLKDGIIEDIKDCKPFCMDGNNFDKITAIPNDPSYRFNEWINAGTFIDSQYNIFNKNFVLKNHIFTDGHRYAALWWLMSAKVFVKTPVICYVHRDAPDSGTNINFPPEKLEKFISNKIKMLHDMDKHFAQIDFFKGNNYIQYLTKAHLLFVLDNYEITRRNVYANGITPEIYSIVESSFKKIFGENYFYPMFLFNWAHVMPYNLRVDNINFDYNAPPDSIKMIYLMKLLNIYLKGMKKFEIGKINRRLCTCEKIYAGRR